jgi:hypothetical protein
MRRSIIIGTALAVLALAGSAFAATALNTYTATHPVSPNKAGSSKSPVAVSVGDIYTAHNATPGKRTAPLTDIKVQIYGLMSNGKYFPTCSLKKIGNAKSDAVCPKGALVASGTVFALIGPVNNPSAALGAPCSLLLDAWNEGQGKVVFSFRTNATHVCLNGAIHTGSIGPFEAKSRVQGKAYTLDTPIPAYVSFPLKGLEGSIMTENLKWAKKTTKVKGKTVAYLASVACLNGKRPYSTSFTAETAQSGGIKQTTTLSSSTKCSK